LTQRDRKSGGGRAVKRCGGRVCHHTVRKCAQAQRTLDELSPSHSVPWKSEARIYTNKLAYKRQSTASRNPAEPVKAILFWIVVVIRRLHAEPDSQAKSQASASTSQNRACWGPLKACTTQ